MCLLGTIIDHLNLSADSYHHDHTNTNLHKTYSSSNMADNWLFLRPRALCRPQVKRWNFFLYQVDPQKTRVYTAMIREYL